MTWLTSRSAMADYLDCPRLRWWRYHFEGKGVERTALRLPLINGDFVHRGIAHALLGQDLLPVLRQAYREQVTTRGFAGEVVGERLVGEQLCLLEGLVRGWVKIRMPALLEEFEVVAVEKELLWEMAPGLVDMVRCDALIRRKVDGMLFILEFKTLGSLTEGWVRQWQHSSQILANTLAVEELFGEPCGGVVIEGLVKGRRAVERAQGSPFYGEMIQHSPLCYGYQDPLTGELVSGWKRSWGKVAIWEVATPEEWVEVLYEEEALLGLFVGVPPIRPIKREQERWRRQAVAQEQEIARKVEVLRGVDGDREGWLDVYFPMNDNHCFRYWGHPCQFEPLCFNAQIETDPVGSGLYQVRVPHHEAERDD